MQYYWTAVSVTTWVHIKQPCDFLIYNYSLYAPVKCIFSSNCFIWKVDRIPHALCLSWWLMQRVLWFLFHPLFTVKHRCRSYNFIIALGWNLSLEDRHSTSCYYDNYYMHDINVCIFAMHVICSQLHFEIINH